MLWELHQQSQIHNAGRSAERAENKAQRAEDQIAQMQRQINHLTLACQSMWEILRDHSDFTEDILEAKILEVDLRDGRNDGKIGGSVLTCDACGKPTNSRRPTCIICGATIKKPHLFES